MSDNRNLDPDQIGICRDMGPSHGTDDPIFDGTEAASANTRKKPRKGFFAVDMNMINRMMRENHGAEVLMGYLVLAGHTSGKGDCPYQLSTAGARGIFQRTGISYRKSKRALEELQALDFISPHHDVRPGLPAKGQYRYKIAVSDSPDWLHLSQTLLSGEGAGVKSPPLSRIYDQLQLAAGLTIGQSRKDVICLLISLYANHSILDFGGVDPRLVWREWSCTGEQCLVGKLALTEVQKREVEVSESFLTECFGQDQQVDRFWYAFNELKRLGFFYEVLMVFEDKPDINCDPEMLYPLYDFYRHNKEPVAHVINRVRLKSWVESDDMEYHEFPDKYEKISQSGLFWYAGDGYPLGIYRLKFRPHTDENGLGFEKERNRSECWISKIKQELRNCYEY
jgi:hypothetical protein